jgi:RIO-like serine/threonine protein kinase
MLMEEINKHVLPILKELEKEVVEYFEMTKYIWDYETKHELRSSIEYGLKRFNLKMEDFNHPYSISKILLLAHDIKENNFNYFSNDWNTDGYYHHVHGYKIKEIINELRPYDEKVKNLISKQFENSVEQSNFYESDEFKLSLEEELKISDLILINDEPKEGQTGIIYFGNQRNVGKRAIKVYKKFLTDKNRSALLKETELIQRIDHPNIVKAIYHRTFEFKGNRILYLVEEFIDGKTIEELKNINLLREKPISLKLKLFYDFIGAIKYIREQLEVHGDIHNENVIITTDNKIKIIDPGFSEYNLDQQYVINDDDRNSISYIMNSLFTKTEQEKLKLNSIHSVEKVPEIISIVQNIINAFNEKVKMDNISSVSKSSREEREIKKSEFERLLNLFDKLYYNKGKTSSAFAQAIVKDKDMMKTFHITIRNPQRNYLDDECFDILGGDYYLIPNSITLRKIDENQKEIELITKNTATENNIKFVIEAFMEILYNSLKMNIEINFRGRILNFIKP